MVVPAAPHDPLPLKGQGADGGLVTFASLDLHLVVAHRPGAELQGTLGQLMEGLAEEFGAGPPHVDPDGFATGFLDRSDAAMAPVSACSTASE